MRIFKKLLFIILIILAILCLTIISIIYLYNRSKSINPSSDEVIIENVEKTTYWGISGYTPTNFPNSNISEIRDFWKKINDYTSTYGVHVDWQDTKLVNTASSQYKGNIVLVLGYQNPDDWGEKKDLLLEKILNILDKNSKIKYLAIGNEINLLREKNPDKFFNFIADYKFIYKQVKQKYPDTQIFTTFNYDSLIGKGYLFGKTIKHLNQTDLIDNFTNYLDLIGVTTYPYMDYASVADIPNNYFEQIEKFNKKIAITETGWQSREQYGNKYKEIDKLRLSGSESEQDQYLNYLINEVKTHPDRFEFINWIFLNDPLEWTNGVDPTQYELFDSIGLNKNDGEEKSAWKTWKTIFE